MGVRLACRHFILQRVGRESLYLELPTGPEECKIGNAAAALPRDAAEATKPTAAS